jgi:hypothetical protein
MSAIVNDPTINEDKITLARMGIEHRATWMALTYLEMEARGLDAEGITRAAVRKCGNIHGLGIKAKCADPGDMRNFKDAFFFEDVRKNFEINVVGVDHDNLKAEFHYCAFVNAWKKLGLDDAKIALFCDIAMDGDRGIAESMGVKLAVGDTIAKGCKTCKLHFSK